jgi:hypothetical protein
MFAPIIKEAFSIIIPSLIAILITELLFILVAKYIANRKGWQKRRAILIGQILWLPVAYLIAVNCIKQLGRLGQG